MLIEEDLVLAILNVWYRNIRQDVCIWIEGGSGYNADVGDGEW